VTLPDGPYETAAGYIAAQLGRVPGEGDEVRADGHRITVTEMDGRRVARVRVSRLPDPQPAALEPGSDT
jgi:putative hemolysin